MDIKKLSFSLVRYTVTQCQLFAPNLKKPYDIPVESISEIIIDNDYENYYFPFFQISVDLPATILRSIKDTPFENHISITIEAGYYDENLDGSTLKAKSKAKYISGKYLAFIDSQYRNLFDSNLEDAEKKEGYDLKESNPQSNQVVSFALYDEQLLNAKDKVFNAVIGSGCLIDFVAFILNKASIKNVLISPPNNYKTYAPFIITPIPAIEQLDRICNDYGLYDYDAMIYFGLDRNYILSNTAACNAYESNEYKTTYFYYSEIDGKFSSSGGCSKDNKEKTNYIIMPGQSTIFKDSSFEAENKLVAEKFNYIRNDDATVTVKDKTGEFHLVTSGDSSVKSVSNRIKSFSKTAIMSLRHIDLEMLTPNKQFNFLIEDKKYRKYSGSYILSRTVIVLAKEGNFFTPLIEASFRG